MVVASWRPCAAPIAAPSPATSTTGIGKGTSSGACAAGRAEIVVLPSPAPPQPGRSSNARTNAGAMVAPSRRVMHNLMLSPNPRGVPPPEEQVDYTFEYVIRFA